MANYGWNAPYGGTPPYAQPGAAPYQYQQQPQQRAPDPQAAAPPTFAELAELSLARLEKLDSDDDQREAFFKGMRRVQEMSNKVAQVEKDNLKTAQQTLAIEEQAKPLEAEVESLCSHAADMHQRVEASQRQRKAVEQSSSIAEKIQKCKAESRSADDSSDMLRSEFLRNNDVDQQKFIADFLAGRRRHHLAESLVHLSR